MRSAGLRLEPTGLRCSVAQPSPQVPCARADVDATVMLTLRRGLRLAVTLLVLVNSVIFGLDDPFEVLLVLGATGCALAALLLVMDEMEHRFASSVEAMANEDRRTSTAQFGAMLLQAKAREEEMANDLAALAKERGSLETRLEQKLETLSGLERRQQADMSGH